MPNPATLADQFRGSLYDLDTGAAREMVKAYQDAYRAMSDRLASWTRLRAELEIRAGIEMRSSWDLPIKDAILPDSPWYGKSEIEIARELAKLGGSMFDKTLADLAAAEFQTKRWAADALAMQQALERYIKVAEGITTDAQGHAIGLGTNDMGRLVDAEMPESLGYSFARPDDRALRAMVGFTQSGAPLSSLFERLAPEMMASVRQTLLNGIALGTNPGVLAYQLRGPLGIPLWRSLTIARTETLRAYREGQRATIAANADVLEGWVWRSARDRRTCEVCWANDGKEFPLPMSLRESSLSAVEVMETHVNCRCTMVPRAKSYAEILGDDTTPDNRTQWGTGQEAFDKMPEAHKLEILGPGKYALYRQGVPLDAMWKQSYSPEWGSSRVSRSIADIKDRMEGGEFEYRDMAGILPIPKSGNALPVVVDDHITKLANGFDNDLSTYSAWVRNAQNTYGKTLPDAVAEMQKILDDAQLTVRRTTSSAAKIITDGRFKTQFETGKSGGAFAPSFRAQQEGILFGYRKDLDPLQRPIYGYFKTNEGSDSAAMYGDVQFVLKAGVRDKTTVTFADSLGASVSPSPANDVHPMSFNNWFGQGFNGYPYIEAQFHGGLTMDDVERIVLDVRDRDILFALRSSGEWVDWNGDGKEWRRRS